MIKAEIVTAVPYSYMLAAQYIQTPITSNLMPCLHFANDNLLLNSQKGQYYISRNNTGSAQYTHVQVQLASIEHTPEN